MTKFKICSDVGGTARGSILFGHRKDHADFTLFSFRTGEVDLFNTFDNNHDEVLPVGEVELGTEWSTSYNGVQPFVQVGFVSQTWFNAGSATMPRNQIALIACLRDVAPGVYFVAVKRYPLPRTVSIMF